MVDEQFMRYRIKDAGDIIVAMLRLIHIDEGFEKFIDDEVVGHLLYERFNISTPADIQKDFQELRAHCGKGLTVLIDCMTRLGVRYGLRESSSVE